MGRATRLSLVFLLLVAAIEIWVYYMERNRRVRALRIHEFVLHELFVTCHAWYIWRRISHIFKSDKAFTVNTIVRTFTLLFLGFAHAAIIVGLFFLDREPAFITRFSSSCLGVTFFFSTSLLTVDIVSFLVRKLFYGQIPNRLNKDRAMYDIKWRTAISLFATVALSLAGVVIVTNLTVERLDIPVHGLNPRLNKTTIVQLSDIHLGGYSGYSTLQNIVDKVNELEPDVVVITGDLVDGAVVYLRKIVDPLRGLKAKHGVFFSTGNHEYYTGDVDNWIEELPKLGVKPLINSRVCLLGGRKEDEKIGGRECEGGLYLAGLEDISTRIGIYGPHHKMDLDAALSTRTKGIPTVVMAHQPSAALLTLEWSDVRLILAGHTHAGQFFPFAVAVYFINPFFVGLYEPRPGVFVYVSPGTVYYIVPFRHYRPEITHFTLISVE